MPDPLVVPLDAGTDPSPALLGGKGASLARLVAVGATVPATAVVTTAAYRLALADPVLADLVAAARRAPDDALLSATDVDRAFLDASVPAAVEDGIRAYADARRPDALAVRSSATAEDLTAASFAGQYRSSLDVVGGDATLRAVRLTWASLWHPNAVAYRRAWGADADDLAMAVVLMTMVAAELAGVVFTIDPSGDPATCRVETVRGVGEALVSGRATPDVALLARAAVLGHDHDAEPPVRAAAAALAIEEREGAPQDVEWAWDGRTVWIVQARPITTSTGDGFDSPADDRELTTAGIAEMLPGVLPPLRWEVDRFLVDEAFRHTLAEAGAPVTAPRLLRRVDGRAAVDFDALRDAAERLGRGSGDDLERRYFGSVAERPERDGADGPPEREPARREHRRWGRSLVAQLRASASRRRALDDAVVVVDAARAFDGASPALASLDDARLLAYRHRIVDFGGRAMTTELAVAAVAVAAYDRLEQWLGTYLGDAGAAAARQLTASASVRDRPGAHASRAVFGGPTWSEAGVDPGGFARPASATRAREAAHRAVEEQLVSSARWRHTRPLAAGLVDLRLHLLRRLTHDAVHALASREAVKDALLTAGGELRRIHLELGRRLGTVGGLEDPADVELLGVAELRHALGGAAPAPALLGQRRRWRTRAEHRGPLAERFRADAPRHEGLTTRASTGVVLEGWAASAGRHTGPAHVVTDPEAAGDLASDAVLVAVSTDASWLPVFLRVGAVVVERGGPLSHAAIVARELGLPAVVNVPGASARLAGATVTVDGDRGTVTVDASREPGS